MRRLGKAFAALAFYLCCAAGLAGSELCAEGLRVVAAENFYGDIAAQIGGARVSVKSLLSDPNVDPHEYESSVDDAKAVADALLVVENGGGYDDWMDHLLSASPRKGRLLLKGYDLAVRRLPNNEHVWYDIDNALALAKALSRALSSLDPAGAASYAGNLSSFAASLEPIRREMADIRSKDAGAPIGLTETIFLYQSEAMGLKSKTPFEFQKAVAEGNDPPAEAIVEAERQVRRREIRILIVNAQTVTPITDRLKAEAETAGLPVVSVTETMPARLRYQDWMLGQLVALGKALEP